MKILEKFLWKLFFIVISMSLIKVADDLTGNLLEEKYPAFKLLLYGIPVIATYLHAVLTLSALRAAFFMLLACATGFIMEYLGLNYGVVFGGAYVYKSQPALFNVPYIVIFYWSVFIYTGYCIVNSFLLWLKIKKPDRISGNLPLLILLIFLDGIMVLAIDLFMDPVEVAKGTWTWLEGGPYFGVPIGNFIGWFILSVLVTGIFRNVEYYYPLKKMKYSRSIFIIPVLCYGLMALSLIISSVRFQMLDLALLGSLLMLPTVLLNLFFYFRKGVHNPSAD